MAEAKPGAPATRKIPLLPMAIMGTAVVFGGLIAWAAFSGDAGQKPVVSAALPPPKVEQAAPPAAEATVTAEKPAAPAAESILPQPADTEPVAALPVPTESGPTESGPTESGPTETTPAETVPTDTVAASPPASQEAPPAQAQPAQTQSVQTGHGTTAPVTAPPVTPPETAEQVETAAQAEPVPVTAPPVSAPTASPPSVTAAPAPTAAQGLPPAPDPRLVEAGRDGNLPVIGPDGRQPWRVYARPFRDITARPRIAIVIAGLGLRESTTVQAIEKLPPDVTLAFTPYARNLDQWSARARATGHEFLIQVPMEPVDFPTSDPGPKALMTTLSPADNKARLEWTLGRATGYIGVMTYMGSRFTADSGAMAETAKQLRSRGLMILDSRTADNSAIGAVAKPIGLPVATAARFIDATPTRAAVDSRLAELERFARQNGIAIGIAADYPGSIERIAAWAATLADKGLVLAPVSALADTTDLP